MLRTVVRGNANFKWYSSTQRAVVDRVVSTSTWPVPYYQRVVKAYPVRQEKEADLNQPDYPICMADWMNTREVLGLSAEGRAILSYTENKIRLDSHLIEMNDCTKMARAYTEDLLGYLDLANQENKRILQQTDLL
jgi:hypothetical protein